MDTGLLRAGQAVTGGLLLASAVTHLRSLFGATVSVPVMIALHVGAMVAMGLSEWVIPELRAGFWTTRHWNQIRLYRLMLRYAPRWLFRGIFALMAYALFHIVLTVITVSSQRHAAAEPIPAAVVRVFSAAWMWADALALGAFTSERRRPEHGATPEPPEQ